MGKVKGIDIPTRDPIQDNNRILGKPWARLCRCNSHLLPRDDFLQSGSLIAGAPESQKFEVTSSEVEGLVERAEVLDTLPLITTLLHCRQGKASRNGAVVSLQSRNRGACPNNTHPHTSTYPDGTPGTLGMSCHLETCSSGQAVPGSTGGAVPWDHSGKAKWSLA